MVVEDCDPIIADGKWLDVLDPATLARMTDGRHWGLEDILQQVLQGEYRLLGVEFSEGRGRLRYEPLAAPFGGSEALVALLEAFGFRVTDDSWGS